MAVVVAHVSSAWIASAIPTMVSCLYSHVQLGLHQARQHEALLPGMGSTTRHKHPTTPQHAALSHPLPQCRRRCGKRCRASCPLQP